MMLGRLRPALTASIAVFLLLAIFWHISWTRSGPVHPLADWRVAAGQAQVPQHDGAQTHAVAPSAVHHSYPDFETGSVISSQPGTETEQSHSTFTDDTITTISTTSVTAATNEGEAWPESPPYTRELVIAKLAAEDTTWIENELGDLLTPNGNLNTSVYVVDDPQAPLHPPVNKGHESIVYFSYIIDRYDSLPDISIFMHSHGGTWHNNDLLNQSSPALVRHLNLDRVQREGYMNLRCHWSPGCRDWIHPASTEFDINKKEEQLIARAWEELFPSRPVPETLAGPCCAQFAVSREQILAHPKALYERMRDWIVATDIPDEQSGRIFEYLWQYIFGETPSLCPHPRICYCDGYGVCFENDESFFDYFKVQSQVGKLWDKINAWREQRDLYEDEDESKRNGTNTKPESEMTPPPEPGLEDRLLDDIVQVEAELSRLKNIALALGQDPIQRAALLEQTWKQIGDEEDWVDASDSKNWEQQDL